MVQIVSNQASFSEAPSISSAPITDSDSGSDLTMTGSVNPAQDQVSNSSIVFVSENKTLITDNIQYNSNLVLNINETINSSIEYNILDNASSRGNVTFHLETECSDFNENQASKRVYSDSSLDTLSTNSSTDELFNSEYTDTITSCDSTDFLIKPSSDSEEECIQDERRDRSESYHCNDGYVGSSTEMLNDSDDGSMSDDCTVALTIEIDNKTEEKGAEEEEDEDEPMLGNNETGGVLGSLESELQNSPLGKSLTNFIHHSLSPITEDEIVSFVVEEIEPSKYGKITDNIIVADESFLFNSEFDLSNKRTRANTMQNIHERSSFLDLTEISKVGKVCQKALVYLKDDITLGSLISLNTALARENSKDKSQSISLIAGGKNDGVLKKGNYMKNLIALSLTITLLYTAVGSVRNLQSSINHEGGVGVIGLAANFLGYVIGSLFSTSAVQIYQPRKTLIVSLFPNVLYVAVNFYPTMWLMVPISLIQGITLAFIANASSTYITFLAKGCAEVKKQTFAEVSARFFGTYSLMYISHLVIGNLVASLILQPPTEGKTQIISNSTNMSLFNGSGNITTGFSGDNSTSGASNDSHIRFCGPNFCHHFDVGGSGFAVAMETKALLFGVYIGCILLAILIAVFFMEPLNPNLFRSTVSPLRKLKTQMISLLKFLVDVKFLLLLPLLMHSTMHFAFLSAEFVKGYITCPIGIHMIGYTMICFGICSSASSFFCGLMTKYIGRVPFIVTAIPPPSLMKTPRRSCVMSTADPSHLLSVLVNG